MVQSAYRPRPAPLSKCSVQNRFIFSWKSLAQDEVETRLPVQKGILRAYLRPISRLLKRDKTVSVDIEIRVGLSGNNVSIKAGHTRVEVNTATNWLEMDVTRGVQQLWPPADHNRSLEFNLTLSVNCKKVKKVPGIFIDPTEIELTQLKRRGRYASFQPLFLIFFNDKAVKDLVHNETAALLNNSLNDDSDLDTVREQNDPDRVTRGKRATNPPCRSEAFSVIFHELHLYYVAVPFMYNARQCSGSCSHTVLTGQEHLGTNHAKIMASAHLVSTIDPTVGFHQEPQEPCCVPTRYSSMSLVVVDADGTLEYKVYPDMRVEECGCR